MDFRQIAISVQKGCLRSLCVPLHWPAVILCNETYIIYAKIESYNHNFFLHQVKVLRYEDGNGNGKILIRSLSPLPNIDILGRIFFW